MTEARVMTDEELKDWQERAGVPSRHHGVFAETVQNMSLRDYFATHAMMRYHYSDHTFDESMAARCYQIADAMLKERDKGKS